MRFCCQKQRPWNGNELQDELYMIVMWCAARKHVLFSLRLGCTCEPLCCMHLPHVNVI